MNKTLKKAILNSALKWKNICESPIALDKATKNCALCKLFDFICTNNDFGTCPLLEMENKRYPSCAGISYTMWCKYAKSTKYNHNYFFRGSLKTEKGKLSLFSANKMFNKINKLLPKKDRLSVKMPKNWKQIRANIIGQWKRRKAAHESLRAWLIK